MFVHPSLTVRISSLVSSTTRIRFFQFFIRHRLGPHPFHDREEALDVSHVGVKSWLCNQGDDLMAFLCPGMERGRKEQQGEAESKLKPWRPVPITWSLLLPIAAETTGS